MKPTHATAHDLANLVTVITPGWAKVLLERVPDHQRRLNERHVKMLAKDMTEGRWRLTGDAIRIDANGNLIDGQHRLLACVHSGVPLKTVLIDGVDPSDFAVIDQGRRRFARDLYKGKNANKMETLARLIMASAETGFSASLFDTWNQTAQFRPADVIDFMENHADALNFVINLSERVRSIFRSQSVYMLILLDMMAYDAEKATEFTERLATGENLKRGDPILALRELLIKSFNATPREPRYLRRSDMACALIKAWNAFASGKQLHRIRLLRRPDDDFPQIVTDADVLPWKRRGKSTG